MNSVEQKIVFDCKAKKIVGYNVLKGTEKINISLMDNDRLILSRISASIAETNKECPVIGFQILETEANGDFINVNLETDTLFTKSVDLVFFLKA